MTKEAYAKEIFSSLSLKAKMITVCSITEKFADFSSKIYLAIEMSIAKTLGPSF